MAAGWLSIPALGMRDGDELGRLAAMPRERGGKAGIGDDPAGDVERHDGRQQGA